MTLPCFTAQGGQLGAVEYGEPEAIAGQVEVVAGRFGVPCGFGGRGHRPNIAVEHTPMVGRARGGIYTFFFAPAVLAGVLTGALGTELPAAFFFLPKRTL